MYVAVNSICLSVLYAIRNKLQYVVRCVEIITVQYTYNIPRSHCNAFVHGIIKPFVLFAHPAHTAVEFWLVLFDYLNSIVFGQTIHNNISLYVCASTELNVSLAVDALLYVAVIIEIVICSLVAFVRYTIIIRQS